MEEKIIYEVGQKVVVVNDKRLPGNDKAPALTTGEEKTIRSIVLDKDGNQHLDLGLESHLNFVRSYETKEELPDGDMIHWCHPSRVKLVD